MDLLVYTIMRVETVFCWRKYCVEFGLANICVEAIDLFKGGIAVDGKAIRAEPNEFAYISLVGIIITAKGLTGEAPYFS
jgi:hypothetical protein